MLVVDNDHGEVGSENGDVTNAPDGADEATAVDEAASVTPVEDEDEEVVARAELTRELYGAVEVNDAVPDVSKAEVVMSVPAKTEDDDVEVLGTTAEEEIGDEKAALGGVVEQVLEEAGPALDGVGEDVKVAEGVSNVNADADDDKGMMLVSREGDVAGALDIGDVDAEALVAALEEELADAELVLSVVTGEMLGEDEPMLDEVAKSDNVRVAEGLDVADDDNAITLVKKEAVGEGALDMEIGGDGVEALRASVDE